MSDEARLSNVSSLSIGQQAALRREAGHCLREADAQALQAFFSAIPPGVPPYEQERYFAAVCFVCLWKEESRHHQRPLAECLCILKKDAGSSADGRFRTLLDTPWRNDDGYLLTKLSRLVRQVRHADVPLYPDFEQLLDDLLHWNAESRYVQRRWMEQYVNLTRKDDGDTKTAALENSAKEN